MSDECCYAGIHRAILDEDRPGWTEETVWCAPHWQYHTLQRAPGQVAMLPPDGQVGSRAEEQTGGGAGDPGRRGWLLPDGRTLCFHGKRSPALYGPCAYCGTKLHVHQDAIAAVKSGRAGTGYLVETCPACHRANAVHPAYGLGGIRTAQMEDGAPAMRMKLIK